MQPLDHQDKLITLKRGLALAEASVLKSVLEANGVPAFLTAGHMAGLNYAVETDLQIRQIDRPRAEHVLTNITPMRAHTPAGEIGDDIHCPTCGTSRLEPVVGQIRTALPFVTIDATPEDRWFKCTHCHSRFQDGPRRFSSLGIALAWAGVMGALTLAAIWVLSSLRYW